MSRPASPSRQSETEPEPEPEPETEPEPEPEQWLQAHLPDDVDSKFPVAKYQRKLTELGHSRTSLKQLDDAALDEIFDAVVDKKASGRMKKGDAALLKQALRASTKELAGSE